MRRVEYMCQSCDPTTLTVRKIMEDAVFTCSPQASVHTVAQVMTERNFGSVPVVEEDMTLVGIISEFDLLKAMREGKDLRQVRAADIMTKDVVTATEDMPIIELAELLQDRHLIRAPVVSGNRLVGIVARRDILFGYVKAVATYWP